MSIPKHLRVTWLTWASHDRQGSNITPRFRTASSGLIVSPRYVTLMGGSNRRFWRLPNTINCVLAALTLSEFAVNHTSRDARVLSIRLIRSPTSSFRPDTSTCVSSAYWTMWASGAKYLRSLANTLYSNGPSAEPWKTPIPFGRGLDRRTRPDKGSVKETLWV